MARKYEALHATKQHSWTFEGKRYGPVPFDVFLIAKDVLEVRVKTSIVFGLIGVVFQMQQMKAHMKYDEPNSSELVLRYKSSQISGSPPRGSQSGGSPSHKTDSFASQFTWRDVPEGWRVMNMITELRIEKRTLPLARAVALPLPLF